MLILLTLLKKQTRTPSNPELLGGGGKQLKEQKKKNLYLYTFILTFSKSAPPYPRQNALIQEQLKKHNLIKPTTVAYYDKYKTMELFKVENKL